MASFKAFITENVDYPLHLVRDAVAPAEAKSLEQVGRGEGKLVRVDGKRVGVYRSPENQLHGVTSVCPHMGCHVHFNTAEKTWDCPCHGSRFDVEGKMLQGPATSDLTKVELVEEKKPAPRESAPTRPPAPSAPH